MIQHLTRTEAQRLIDAMGVEVTLPVSPDLDWFAFYGGQYFPRNVVFSHYITNDDGLMGIIARQHVELPKRVMPKVEETVKEPKPTITIELPYRTCPVCKRPFKYNPAKPFTCCSWQCQQTHKQEIERIEQADKESEVYPF